MVVRMKPVEAIEREMEDLWKVYEETNALKTVMWQSLNRINKKLKRPYRELVDELVDMRNYVGMAIDDEGISVCPNELIRWIDEILAKVGDV